MHEANKEFSLRTTIKEIHKRKWSSLEKLRLFWGWEVIILNMTQTKLNLIYKRRIEINGGIFVFGRYGRKTR